MEKKISTGLTEPFITIQAEDQDALEQRLYPGAHILAGGAVIVGERVICGFRKALESAANDYSCSLLSILEHFVGISSAILL